MGGVKILKYIVQYFPLTCSVGRIILLDESRDNKEIIERFYEEVNASDYYHNSIIFFFDSDSTKSINQIIKNAFRDYYNQ